MYQTRMSGVEYSRGKLPSSTSYGPLQNPASITACIELTSPCRSSWRQSTSSMSTPLRSGCSSHARAAMEGSRWWRPRGARSTALSSMITSPRRRATFWCTQRTGGKGRSGETGGGDGDGKSGTHNNYKIMAGAHRAKHPPLDRVHVHVGLAHPRQ